MHNMDVDKTQCEKDWRELHKKAMSYREQILKATPPVNDSCMATYLSSLKLSKWEEQDMWDITGKEKASS